MEYGTHGYRIKKVEYFNGTVKYFPQRKVLQFCSPISSETYEDWEYLNPLRTISFLTLEEAEEAIYKHLGNKVKSETIIS